MLLLINECRVLRITDHNNLMKSCDIFLNQQTETLYMVLEYCQAGSLAELYEDMEAPFEEYQIIFILHETLKALEYLHSLGIVHRDIKGSNILLTRDGELKIGDFGMCGSLKGIKIKKSENFVGTPHWMAPEVFQTVMLDSSYDEKVDIWSVGITIIDFYQPP
eukprot:TRINITY_DN2620_c0_g1_i17.p1 TRINITY_DN2620_c0_g1~~TRINITY_DN2620_c0_g1_i17.p1  ORF type:complete len:163 (+),score=24.17 TRINITY_DN2620_c0_g1_i17:490-978(+)